MNFKKLIVTLALAATLIVPGFALACDGPNCNGHVSDSANGSGWAADPDHSYSVSNHGYGNDSASAGALGGGGFNVNAATTGSEWAEAEVFGYARGEADTCTYARDYGTTSVSGAKSTITGNAYAGGVTAAGPFWCGTKSIIEGNTYFKGNVNQSNSANEVGYSVGGIGAGNSSSVDFYNGRSFKDTTTCFGMNYEDGSTRGVATTEGHTQVSIDPYGNNLSIDGKTSTRSYFDTNHRGDSKSAYMTGNGGINGGLTNNYGAFVSGGSSFSYDGVTDGAGGGAYLNANINKTSGSTTVTINTGANSHLSD